VAKRIAKAAPAKVRRPPEPKPTWPHERHSGEGAASALQTLQKMEKRRIAARAAEPLAEDDPAG
jgi:hypothetical protein